MGLSSVIKCPENASKLSFLGPSLSGDLLLPTLSNGLMMGYVIYSEKGRHNVLGLFFGCHWQIYVDNEAFTRP